MTRLAQIPLALMLLATSLLLVGCGSSSNNKDVGIPDGPSVASDVPNALSLDTSPDRHAEIEVGDASDATGTTLDATLEDALAPQDGPAAAGELACGTQTCHAGQVCFYAISGAVGFPDPSIYCEDLGASCSDACCACRAMGGMCEGGGPMDVTCAMP